MTSGDESHKLIEETEGGSDIEKVLSLKRNKKGAVVS